MERSSFLGQIGDTEIRLLRVFKTVTECGGFTPAEAELDLARSTISTHIAHLETRLGFRLCERGRGGFSLTEEGRLVYRETVRLMTALDGFRAEIAGARRRLTGEFNLTVIDGIQTLPEIPISNALARFRKAAPDVHVTIGVHSTEEMEQRVQNGTAHAAFAALHRRKSGLAYREVAGEVQYVYCGRGHPLFDVPDAEIDLPVLQRFDTVGRTFLDIARSRQAPLTAGPAASANNLEAIEILLKTGCYLGLLPSQYAHGNPDLRALRPDMTRVEQQFALITRDTARPAPVVEAFCAAFDAALGAAT